MSAPPSQKRTELNSVHLNKFFYTILYLHKTWRILNSVRFYVILSNISSNSIHFNLAFMSELLSCIKCHSFKISAIFDNVISFLSIIIIPSFLPNLLHRFIYPIYLFLTTKPLFPKFNHYTIIYLYIQH